MACTAWRIFFAFCCCCFASVFFFFFPFPFFCGFGNNVPVLDLQSICGVSVNLGVLFLLFLKNTFFSVVLLLFFALFIFVFLAFSVLLYSFFFLVFCSFRSVISWLCVSFYLLVCSLAPLPRGSFFIARFGI